MLIFKSITSALIVALTMSPALAESLKFIEQTDQGAFKILDQDKSGGNSMGDIELWSAPAADADGKEIGKSSGHCLYISETYKHCTWSLTTNEGNLVFVGVIDNTKPLHPYTIVGGDKAYVGASGSMNAIDKYKEKGIYEIEVNLDK